MSWYASKKLWCVVGGAAGALLIERICRVPAIRDAAVKVASSAVIYKENCDAAVQSFKDDTEDLILFVGRNCLQLIIWAAVLFGAWKFLRGRKRPHFPKLRRRSKKNNEESDTEA